MIILNQSNVTFDYVLPDQSTQSGEQNSNVVQTEVLSSSVSKVKSSDKAFLNEGETARQKVVVTNNSSVYLAALIFKDIMTSGATYVAGSVAINGVGAAFVRLGRGLSASRSACGRKRDRRIHHSCQ